MNKQDGKFVEFPDPNASANGERSHFPPLTNADREEDELRKLDKLAVEYNFLLTRYFEVHF